MIFFTNLHPPDPTKPHNIYHASDLDFTLNPKRKAIDKGIVIPNVNDDFKGTEPDLGAIEAGEPVPVYCARGTRDAVFLSLHISNQLAKKF
jgi:hypothetical protein